MVFLFGSAWTEESGDCSFFLPQVLSESRGLIHEECPLHCTKVKRKALVAAACCQPVDGRNSAPPLAGPNTFVSSVILNKEAIRFFMFVYDI